MRVVVAGTINRDTLIFPGNKTIESLGGLIYSVVALANLIGGDGDVVPVANVGEDVIDRVLLQIARHPNVRIEGLRRVEEPNNHVILHCDGPEKREILHGVVPPIYAYQFDPFVASAGYVVLNFTSGFDMPLQTVKALAERGGCPIHMDVHSLTLGKDRDGNRVLRALPNWRDWLAQADTLQMNEAEAAILAGRKVDSPAEIERFAAELLRDRTRTLLVTLGDRGVVVATRQGGGVVTVSIAADEVPEPVDTTGCGDVLGAGFVCEMLRGADPVDAARRGMHLASRKCGIAGVDGLGALLQAAIPRGARRPGGDARAQGGTARA